MTGPSSKRAGTVQEHKQTFPTPLHHGSPSSDFPDTNSNRRLSASSANAVDFAEFSLAPTATRGWCISEADGVRSLAVQNRAQ
jgi:hypothetical protein